MKADSRSSRAARWKPELIDDAEYYCGDPHGPGAGDRDYLPLRNAAKALLKALAGQGAYAGKFRYGG